MSAGHKTTDHDEIRTWAESHGGRPAKVETKGEGGILRFDFQDKDDNLTEIDWDEFFEIFEDSKLAVILQSDDEASGKTSRFSKFVNR